MNSDNYINLFTPACIIIAGVLVRFPTEKNKLAGMKKYSLLFIIGGGLTLLYRLWKLSNL